MSTSRACTACYTPLPPQAKFCLECGAETPITPSEGSELDAEGQTQRLTQALTGLYEVRDELGRGGMATVYLAEDLKHHRQVALKVMRPKITTALGPERFLREIDIAARLVHPHILPVHDSGEADGFLYYVMPLVEGETLRARLVREGELPVVDTIRIVRDVADALAYAHRQGVVHRDVKPDNIMLAGRHAFVMDFGVAKALREAATGQTLTTMGVSLGTPAYMAPEQAAGDSHLDHRADIYALGVVAYELLAGEPPFGGKTPQSVMTKHVTEEPKPISERRASVPEPLAQLVMRALRKKAADRWQSAEELLRQLELVSTPSGGMAPISGAQVPAPPRWRRRLALAGAAAFVVAIAGYVAWLAQSRNVAGVFAVTPTFRQVTFTGDAAASAISPDGRYLAYTRMVPDSGAQLWIQDLVGSGRPLRLAEGYFPQQLKWSPDGSGVLFLSAAATNSSRGWYTVPMLGGQPQQVARGAFVGLSRDGTRAAWGYTAVQRLWLQERSSGDTMSIGFDGSFTWIWDVAWAPGDERLAVVTRDEERTKTVIWTIGVDGTERHEVVVDSVFLSGVQWAADGEAIYYLRQGDFTAEVWKVPLRSGGERAGPPRAVIGGVVAGAGMSLGDSDRVLAYTRVADYSNLALYRFDSDRNEYTLDTELTSGTSMKGVPKISPDGTQFAYSDGDGARRNVFVMPVEGGAPRQLTFGDASIGNPVWSPSGRTLAYAGAAAGRAKVSIVSATGGAPRVFENSHVSPSLHVVWGPGESILYQVPGNRNYSVLDPSSEDERLLVPNDTVGWLFLDNQQAYSPDGSKVLGFWNRRPHGFWLISMEDSTQTHLWEREGHLELWADDSESVWWHSFEAGDIRRRSFDGASHELATRPWPSACPQGDYSPDRSYIVCWVQETNRDVWLIENFDPTLSR